MHDVYLTFSDNEYWTGLRQRLEPFFGNLPRTFGPDWMDVLEEAFPRASNQAVATSTWNGGAPPVWIEVEMREGGLPERARRYFENNVARRMDVALAWMAVRFRDAGFWPDAIAREPGSFTFFKSGRVVVRLKPLALTTVAQTERARAVSTLTGLRRHEPASAEFEKRVRRWPGMKSLQFEEEGRRGHRGHFAVPSEWLDSARLLFRLAKRPEPRPDQVQAVAVAALGASSWNQLVAPADIQACSACCPWEVADENVRIAAFADPFEAFAFLMRRAPHWLPGKQDVRFSRFSGSDGFPSLGFSEPVKLRPGPDDNIEASLKMFAMPPAIFEEPSEFDFVGKVRAALAQPGVSALEPLFGIGAGADIRVREHNDFHGENTVAEEGPYRITMTDTHLWVRKHEADGAITWQATIARHRGAIWRHPSGLLVMSNEYDLDDPVGVLPAFAQWTMEGIHAAMARSSDHMSHMRSGNVRYYRWQGSAADQAIDAAAKAIARGVDVDLSAIEFSREALFPAQVRGT